MLETEVKPRPSMREWIAAHVLRFIPNALTLGAILCGFAALLLSGDHRFGLAMAAIAAAALLDIADGLAARWLNAASALGAELDSLADFLNFGIAPAMVVYQRDLYRLGWAGWIIAACYVTATVMRLAQYNVSLKSGEVSEEARIFSGLPSTAAAILALLAAYALNFANSVPGAAALGAFILALAALMISPIPVPSLQIMLKHFRQGRRQSGG